MEQVNDEKVATERERQLELFISTILKYGVLISSGTVLIGGIMYLIGHSTDIPNYGFFHGQPSQLSSPWGVVKAVLSGNRYGIMQLGLLILIATPIVRVAFSVLTFLKWRDSIYVFLTLVVFAELMYSFIGVNLI